MKTLLFVLFLYSVPALAQKSYEDLLIELKEKALKNTLEWSDIGDLVDTIEAESDDPKYRAALCDTTLFWLESFLPNTYRASRRPLGAAALGPLNIAILRNDLPSVLRNIVRDAHRTYDGNGDGPLHAVMHAGRGTRPLHTVRREERETVSFENRLQALRLLLLMGVELDGRDNEGRTPLVHAILDWPSFVPLLLAAGANPNIADNEGHSALFYVVRSGHKGDTALEIMRKLIRNQADVNPSHEAGRTLLGQLAILDRGDLINELLENNAHPWILDSEARTALHWAVLFGSLEAVKALLKHFESRADRLEYVNAKDKSGMTPLLLAFSEVPPELLEKINTIKKGVVENRFEIARLLIEAGALPTQDAQTMLDLVILYGVVEPVQLLPIALITSLSENDKMHLLLGALGKLPVVWEELLPQLKSRRGEIFLVLWRVFEMDLTFGQVEALEAVAAANGFDIILEWLLQLKAYSRPLTANQKLALLLQLTKPLPQVSDPLELGNYRNARRRIWEQVLADTNDPLTAEQAAEIETRGRENGFDDFFDFPLWQNQRDAANAAHPHSRSDSAARRALTMVKRVTKSLLPSRRGSSESESSKLPRPDRDFNDDGAGGGIRSPGA